MLTEEQKEKHKLSQYKWNEAHKEQLNEYRKKYEQEHKEHLKELRRRWEQDHREERKERKKQTDKVRIQTHKEERKEAYKRFIEEHPDYNKQYYYKNHEKMRQLYAKLQNKRYRELGFIPLNNYVKGYEAHHVNKECVIYIPKYIHRQHWHNHKKPETMKEVNKFAFNYLFGISQQVKL